MAVRQEGVRAAEATCFYTPPQPAPSPEAYVQAQAALDALVAAIGADQERAA
jgi:hypothetical protein